MTEKKLLQKNIKTISISPRSPYGQLMLLIGMIFLLALLSSVKAQSTMRGSVRDADNGQILTGATVFLPTIQRGMDTDSLGGFRFTDLPPGRYPVVISYLGYQQLTMNEVLVSSGKEQVLDVVLQEAATSLTAVTVKASRQPNSNTSPNILNLSQEETLRFPATFNDPARLATAYAGVSGANDQANHLIIRGQSPLGMQWRLEGLEIVNPNHTANAGTFTDRTTLSGGGVNALSAQLLQEANFYLGAPPATLGNTTTALMDMRLRNGNNEQREYTIQAGLIGFDLAAEGPIRQGKSSYLINYRYSFTGLLSDLGVPLGNEDIRFQDLSFKLHFPSQKGGSFSLFGLLGKSSNEFNQPTDTAEWESEKDLYNIIDFNAEMATFGVRWAQPQGDNARWYAAAAWSGVRNQRLGVASDLRSREWDDLRQEKTSFQLSYRRKLLPFGSITLGIEALHIDQSVEREFPFDSEGIASRSSSGLVISPYINWRYQIKRLSLDLGWRLSQWVDWLDERSYSEPRLAVGYLLNKKNTIGGDLAIATQAPSPYELALRPRRSRLYSLYWNRQFSDSRKINIQLYQQNLTQITGIGALSAVNQIAQILPETDATSQARVQGVELTIQQFATGGWWYVLGASLFDARYEDENGEWVKSRFAQDYTSTLTLGKEWSGIDRKKQVNRIGFNLALHYNGGLRAAPIDQAASAVSRFTVFDYNQGYSEQLPAYFRTDLRIYYQKNRTRWNSMLSLDIQNVTGQQNIAYDYYDRFLQQVDRRYQLEFIPILSYRINF